MRRKSAFLGTFISITLLLSYAGPSLAFSLAGRVNRDDKSFSGTWVHRIKTPGQDDYSVISRVDIEVKGRKYHISGEGEELLYDGEVLRGQVEPARRALREDPLRDIRIPFWKMDIKASPHLPLNLVGTETVAGRKCNVYRISGDYKEGDVSVTYWIDQDKEVLLKKEYILVMGKRVLRESYESVSVEFDLPIPPEAYEAGSAGRWKEIERSRLKGEYLETKF